MIEALQLYSQETESKSIFGNLANRTKRKSKKSPLEMCRYFTQNEENSLIFAQH